jgi:hypothetical protein
MLLSESDSLLKAALFVIGVENIGVPPLKCDKLRPISDGLKVISDALEAISDALKVISDGLKMISDDL